MEDTRMFDFPLWYEKIAARMPDDCRVVECGIANGDSALYLAKELHRLGKRFKMYMVDNFDYGQYFQMKVVYENIIKSGLGDFIEVHPYDSVTASGLFPDGSLNLVFIDTSHLYDETKDSIKSWWPKVIDGGILSGHDYLSCAPVQVAVDELIPKVFTREQINQDPFEPENFLHIEGTTNGNGVWWCQKDFYKFLNV